MFEKNNSTKLIFTKYLNNDKSHISYFTLSSGNRSGFRYFCNYAALMPLNGYNVLADNNYNKSFGLQLGFKPSEKAGESNSGLKAYGVTLGTEFNPAPNSFFRLEGRYLSSDKDQLIFYDSKNTRGEVILSGGIEF